MNGSRKKEKSKLNWANAFTTLRLPLALYGMYRFIGGDKWLGVLVIVGAAFTDFFDGIIARKTHCVTDFGAQFDPIVDKIFMGLMMVFVYTQIHTFEQRALLAAVLVVESIAILCTFFAKQNDVTLKVSWFGKKGMFARMTCVSWMLASTIGVSSMYETIGKVSLVAGLIGIGFGSIADHGYWLEYSYSAKYKKMRKTVKV